MRVLFADNLPASCVEATVDAGYEVTVQPELDDDTVGPAAAGYDVLVVRSTRVTAEAIEAAPSLGLIVRAGAGVNTIDVDAAAAAAIQVANVPGENAVAVAELTMGLMLAIDRRIADSVIDSRAGRWDKKMYSKGRGIQGRSLGILGLGAIGMAVARRARAFDMTVMVVDRPDPTRAEAVDALGLEPVATQEELVRRSEFLTVHVPAAPSTKGLLGPDLLEHVQPGTVIINTSRGDTIDEAALLAAVEEKDLWVGLDVYPYEPSAGQGEFVSALASHPRVYGTHHIGASTERAQEAVGQRVVEILRAYRSGAEISTVVNLSGAGASLATVSVRHKNRVGVLSDVLAGLRRAGLNVEDMSNRIFAGGDAAVATIRVSGTVSDDLLADLRDLANVLAVTVTE